MIQEEREEKNKDNRGVEKDERGKIEDWERG